MELDSKKPLLTKDKLNTFMVQQQCIATDAQINMLMERLGGIPECFQNASNPEAAKGGISLEEFVKALTPVYMTY